MEQEILVNVKDNLVWANLECDNWHTFESAKRRRQVSFWSGPYLPMATHNILLENEMQRSSGSVTSLLGDWWTAAL